MRGIFVSPLGCALLAFVLGVLTPGNAASDATQEVSESDSTEGDRPPDLTLQLPITAGDYEFTQFTAAVPGFALQGARLDPDSSKTRLMLGVRFTSKSVRSAVLEVALLEDFNDSQQRIHTLTHVEEVGPDEVRRQGHNIDAVRKWDGPRALWFDLPEQARRATALRVNVRLDKEGDAEGQK